MGMVTDIVYVLSVTKLLKVIFYFMTSLVISLILDDVWNNLRSFSKVLFAISVNHINTLLYLSADSPTVYEGVPVSILIYRPNDCMDLGFTFVGGIDTPLVSDNYFCLYTVQMSIVSSVLW